MRHQLIIAYNDRTQVLRLFDETDDHYKIVAGEEAEKFWNIIRDEIRKPSKYPAGCRDNFEPLQGREPETSAARKPAE